MPTFFQKLRASGIVRTTSAMMATRAISIMMGVALSVLLARWLAPDGYGDYLFTLTAAQFLAMPVLAGLPTLVVREVAINRGSGDADGLAGILHWSARFIFFSVLGVVVIGSVSLFLADSNDGSLSVYYLALPLVLALAFLRFGSAVVQGYEHPFAGSLADGLIRPALLLGLLLMAHAAGFLSPMIALWMHFFAATLAAGFALVYWLVVCREKTGAARPKPRYETRKWLTSLWPLSLITLASLLNSRLDILMLGVLSAAKDVANYGIAVQLAGLVVIGQTIVNSIVAPKIARIYARADSAQLRRIVTYAARISASIALGMLAVIVLLGAQVIDALLGEGYAEAWPAAIVLCVGHLFSSLMGPVAVVMNMTGNERDVARIVWASAIINGVLNLFLIPLYGVIGAAIATGATLILYQAIMAVWVSRKLGINCTILRVS